MVSRYCGQWRKHDYMFVDVSSHFWGFILLLCKKFLRVREAEAVLLVFQHFPDPNLSQSIASCSFMIWSLESGNIFPHLRFAYNLLLIHLLTFHLTTIIKRTRMHYWSISSWIFYLGKEHPRAVVVLKQGEFCVPEDIWRHFWWSRLWRGSVSDTLRRWMILKTYNTQDNFHQHRIIDTQMGTVVRLRNPSLEQQFRTPGIE